MKTTNEKLVFLFVNLILYVLLASVGYNQVMGVVLFISLILINSFLIIKSYRKKNTLLLILFIYTFIYAFVIKNAFIDDLQISLYSSFNDYQHLYDTTLLFFLFYIFLYFFLKIDTPVKKPLFEYRNNIFIFYIFLILAVICAVFGKSGDNIFDAGGYATGASSSSSLNEYFLIPLFISIIFSNNSKKRALLIYCVVGFYIIKNLLFGGRIEVVMAALTIFIWKFYHTISIKKIVIYSVIGFYFFAVIGNIRSNPMVIFGPNWTNVFMLSFKSNDLVILSQEGDVLYATNRLVSMANEGIISLSERIMSFFYFVVSLFTPYSYLPDIANLSSYKVESYPVGGGGLIFGFFYVYFSYIGVILISYFLTRILNSFIRNNNSFFLKIYSLFVFITLPRWFAYSPVILFKLCLYGTLITILVLKFDLYMKKVYSSVENNKVTKI